MSREFFNQKAEEWDEITEHSRKIIADITNHLPHLTNPNILDVGCGTGVMIEFLINKYGPEAKITAIDYAENMISKARKKFLSYPNISYVTDDVLTYNFAEASYDLIVCYSVFPHLQEKQSILQKFHKILSKKGYLVIFHSESRQKINELHRNIGGTVGNDHLPPAKHVAQMANDIGFKVETLIDNEIYFLLLKK